MGSRPARTLSQGERNIFLNECGREGSGDSAGMTLETDSVEFVFSCFTWVPGWNANDQACARKSLYHLNHFASSHFFFSFFVVLGLESNTRSAVVLTPLAPAILQLLVIEIYLFENGSPISLVWP